MAYKILFIDDDEFMQKIYADRFAASEIDVVTVGTVKDAQDAFAMNEFDLVCTDYVLPDKTGLDLVHWMRNDKRMNTPIIVLSASGQDAPMNEIRQAGANDYVQKDHVTPALLMDKIKALVDASRTQA